MKLGAFGLGNMGAAFVGGVIRGGVVAPQDVFGFDPWSEAGQGLELQRMASAREAAAASDVWLLAVKPAGIAGLLDDVRDQASGEVLVISVAAGVPLSTLVAHAPEGALVVRVMPNLAASKGASATGWVASRAVSEEERSRINTMLSSVGVAIELADEEQLHAFTAAVGSGIAYLFLAAEAIADGAVAEGLPRPIARQVAAAAITGAGALLEGGAQSPAELKDRVCSPGGTTIEGIVALERSGVRAAFVNAVREAARRSRELARK